MFISDLSSTPFEKIVSCLTTSFVNYFVPMPEDVDFWRSRFAISRVDYSLSYGVFDDDELVAFVLNGIDYFNNEKVAFNTGTGVIPSHRGLQLVDKIYTSSTPILKSNKVQKCTLDVITKNHRAIKVYERIGFEKVDTAHCFNGEISHQKSPNLIKKTSLESIRPLMQQFDEFHHWDHCYSALLIAQNLYSHYEIWHENDELLGYFCINTSTGDIAQFEASSPEFLTEVFSAISSISSSIKMNNISSKRIGHLRQFQDNNISNTLDQYAMSMQI